MNVPVLRTFTVVRALIFIAQLFFFLDGCNFHSTQILMFLAIRFLLLSLKSPEKSLPLANSILLRTLSSDRLKTKLAQVAV